MKKFLLIISFAGHAIFASGQLAAPGAGITLHAYRNFQGDKPGAYTAGPVTFKADKPSEVNLIADQTALGRIYAGEYVNYKWYALVTKPGTQSGVEGLAEIDLATGERKMIAVSDQTRHLTDMTYDYTTNTMFGIASSAEKLAKIDLKTSDVTLIDAFRNQASEAIYALALACDLDGKLYLISTGDTLYTVDKETAVCFPVGFLEADAAFTQTMTFDHHTHTLYWTNNADYRLYTVDPATGKATSQGSLGAGGGDSMGSLFIPFIQVAAGAPDRVVNRKAESFADHIVVSWEYPQTDAQGNPLAELTKASLYRDNRLIREFTLTSADAGETATFTDTGISTGKHAYRIVCENSKGKGGTDDDDLEGYAGDNPPGKVESFAVVSKDNTAVLSWEAPSTGAYDGVYKPEDLQGYTICRISDSKKEEIKLNDASATHYTDATGFGKYAYSISAFNKAGTGLETTSPVVLVKPDDWYIMSNGTCTVTEGKFYDAGGPDGFYKNAENLVMTLKPALANSVLVGEFTEFSVDNYGDTLAIYDGVNTASRLIGKYSSLSLPADLKKVMATNPEGALTFRFYSDVSFPGKGWEANLSCMQKKEFDLVASKIEGDYFPSQNQPAEYKITFSNFGTGQVDGSAYQVGLTDENGRMIAQTGGVNIQSMETKTVTVSYTPQAGGTILLKGYLAYEKDDDPSNNTTGPISVNVQAEGSRYVSIGDNPPSLAVLPASFFMENSLGQTLYTASQIQTEPGILQMISYPMKADMSYNPVNLEVWVAETDRNDLENGNIRAKEMTKVYEGNTPFESGDKEWRIVFDTPFAYTGKNLVVLIHKSGSQTDNMGVMFCGTYGDPEAKPASRFTSSETPIDPDATMDEYSGSTMQPDIRLLFTKPSAISETKTGPSITVWPNPFTDYIRIDGARRLGKCTLSDLSGKVVLENTSGILQTSSLDKGIYILNVATADGEAFRQKIIKK